MTTYHNVLVGGKDECLQEYKNKFGSDICVAHSVDELTDKENILFYLDGFTDIDNPLFIELLTNTKCYFSVSSIEEYNKHTFAKKYVYLRDMNE